MVQVHGSYCFAYDTSAVRIVYRSNCVFGEKITNAVSRMTTCDSLQDHILLLKLSRLPAEVDKWTRPAQQVAIRKY